MFASIALIRHSTVRIRLGRLTSHDKTRGVYDNFGYVFRRTCFDGPNILPWPLCWVMHKRSFFFLEESPLLLEIIRTPRQDSRSDGFADVMAQPPMQRSLSNRPVDDRH
jgi:hypothetical protein